MDWSLLGCGAGGHVTFAPDEPALRDQLSTPVREGMAWRCLRCGTFVVGPPTASGPAAAAPRVRRDKEVRSALILRVFAVERFLRAILFAVLSVAVWRFSLSRLSIEGAYNRELPAVRSLLRQLGFNVNHSKLLGLIRSAFTLDSRTLALLAIGAAAYAAIELIEGIGLWLLKRWGEYFAAVATSVGLPYEIYDLTAKVTVLRVVAFLINLALVVYLVLTKRLFGARGGKKAYKAALRSESILDAEINALEAERAATVVPAEPTAAAEPTATADTTETNKTPATPEPTGADEVARAGNAPAADEAAKTGQAAAPGDAARTGEAAAPGDAARTGQAEIIGADEAARADNAAAAGNAAGTGEAEVTGEAAGGDQTETTTPVPPAGRS